MLGRIIILVSFFIGVQSFGQAQQYVSFKNFQASDFGVEKMVHQVWDESGAFWANSDLGIFRHNGYSKKVFPLDTLGKNNGPISTNIIGIEKVDTDEFWITYSDTSVITRITPSIEKFENFHVKELLTDSVLSAVVVRVEKDNSGQYWLCTWGTGLVKFDLNGENSKVYKFRDSTAEVDDGFYVKDIAIDENNQIFVTFFNGRGGYHGRPVFFDPSTEKYSRFNFDEFTAHHPEDMMNNINVAIKIIHWVHQDSAGNYWLGSYSGPLFIDMKNRKIERVFERDANKSIQNQANTGSYCATESMIWMTTINSGIIAVDINTGEVNFHSSDAVNSSSLPSNRVNSVSKDPYDNIWILNGTNSVSVYCGYIHNFKTMYWKDMDLEYSNRSNQNIPVNQFYVKNSHEIYVSSKLGLLMYDYETMRLSKFYKFKRIAGAQNHGRLRGVEHFKVMDDKIYLSNDTYPHVYYPEQDKLIMDKIGYGTGKIGFRHEDKIDRLIYFYSSKTSSIIEYDQELKNRTTLLKLDIGLSERFSFLTNNGSWMFSEENGRFVLIQPEDSTYQVYSPSSKEHYFPDSSITCALIQAGPEILIGTRKGLYSFNETTGETENISKKAGLKDSEGVNSIVKDNQGRIWMALSFELLCWNPNTDETLRYGKSLGVNGSNFLPAIGQKDELGNLYFVTMYGILIFNPEDVELPKDPIKLTLSRISVDDQIANDELFRLISAGGHQFEYDQNFLEFEFHTNQVFELSPHQFSYKLVGLNERWINCGPTNKVRFDNLQSGEYELQYKVKNTYGVESEIFSIPFEIKKPFWKKWWFYGLIVLFFLGLVYLLVKGRMKALRKRSELLEQTVTERTAEVVEQKKEAEKQKEEAEHQKEIVEEKQKEITDSITYAKRIQDAILPSSDLIKRNLPLSFVLYKPKDIVAGDFYWLEPINEDEVIFAAADCTGHGVPGAMVSVVCNNALNRTVREFGITDPGKLLDKTRDLVVEQFEQSKTESKDAHGATIKDGMDIALCYLNKKTRALQFAGANNPIWIIRNGELIETKGDKQPIGKFDPSTPFTTSKIQMQKDDRVYIFSDGYADQFGGEKGKKFKSSSMKKLLIQIHQEPINVQLEKLENNFESWKGTFEQLDDVCVIGFQID